MTFSQNNETLSGNLSKNSIRKIWMDKIAQIDGQSDSFIPSPFQFVGDKFKYLNRFYKMSMGHITHKNYFVSLSVILMKEKVSRGVFSRAGLASARQNSHYLQNKFWRALALLNTPQA